MQIVLLSAIVLPSFALRAPGVEVTERVPPAPAQVEASSGGGLPIGTPLGATVIDFDDIEGVPCPCPGGGPTSVVVDDAYLSRGVRFRSEGGGVALAAGGNPVSPPNVATSTQPGPTFSYTVPTEATFVHASGAPGVVDFVRVTLTDSSSEASLEAYDVAGSLLHTSSGGASATLRARAPGRIHRVTIHQGPMAFDDFTFGGLAPAPVVLVADADPDAPRLGAVGATPGAAVAFLGSARPSVVGSSPSELASPALLGVARAGAEGRAFLDAPWLADSRSGDSWFQALELDSRRASAVQSGARVLAASPRPR